MMPYIFALLPTVSPERTSPMHCDEKPTTPHPIGPLPPIPPKK